MAALSDNRATVTVGGEEYEVEASNGACMLYAQEFRDREEEPFTGSLPTDVLIDLGRSDGNPYPLWCDAPRLLGAVWAMARAAGSAKSQYKAFEKRAMDATADALEVTDATRELLGDGGLFERTFFRRVPGPQGAGQPDETQGGRA